MTDATAPPACLFCGEPEQVSLFEIWDDHSFQFETCCAALHERISDDMAADPAWGRELLRRLGAETLTGITLRRVTDGLEFLLDGQLEIRPIAFGKARDFVARHHGHCAAPRGWRFGAAIWNGWTMMGVVTVGSPVARMLNGTGTVEVNRLCIRRDTAPMLRWNCCSMLYGWSAREAERRGLRRIVTYTREDEDGTSLVAAGWSRDATTRAAGWHGSRRRCNSNAWIAKTRWSRSLKPKRTREPGSRSTAGLPTTDWATIAGLRDGARSEASVPA